MPEKLNAQAIQVVDDMIPVAADIVKIYCMDRNIDEKDIPPNVWNDIITELYIKLFKPCNKVLKLKGGIHNEYDIHSVEYVYKYIYKRLCDSHSQEVTLKGFIDMTGISHQNFYDWESGKLSSQRSDLHKKIMEDNEESLFGLMKDRRYNPMKILPKLNKVHGWNMPGVGREGEKNKIPSAADLPQLGCKNGQNTSMLTDSGADTRDNTDANE